MGWRNVGPKKDWVIRSGAVELDPSLSLNSDPRFFVGVIWDKRVEEEAPI